MKKIFSSLKNVVGLVALVALTLGLVWLFSAVREGAPVGQPTVVSQERVVSQQVAFTPTKGSSFISPLPTPITPIPTLPPTPTIAPTPTIPPVPTPLPTPVVTPIPLATPPFIPGIKDKPTEPYKIVVREENTLWVMNNDGTDKRMLIDTEKELSLLLGYNPLLEPRIGWGSASPDGNELALVLSKQALTKEEAHSLRHHIYLLDVDTGRCSLLVEDGTEPVWSPDGKRIAYKGPNLGLWIADIATRTTREIFPVKKGYEATGFAWSPSGQKIAFLNKVASLGGTPEMLVVNTDSTGEVVQLIPRTGWYFGGLRWSPDGQRVLYVFSETEPTGQHFDNLWIVDMETHASASLTTQAIVSSFALNPSGGDWIVFTGKYPYEEEPSPPNDLWLIAIDGSHLLRLTRDSISDRDPWWSPDGTQIVFQRAEHGIWTINLSDGNLKQVYPENVDFAITR